MSNESPDHLHLSYFMHWGLSALVFGLALVLVVPVAPMSVFLRTAGSAECFQRISRSLLGSQKLKFIGPFLDRRWFVARRTCFRPASGFAVRLSLQLVKTLILALFRSTVTAISKAKSALPLEHQVRSIGTSLDSLPLKFDSLFSGACCKSCHQNCCASWWAPAIAGTTAHLALTHTHIIN